MVEPVGPLVAVRVPLDRAVGSETAAVVRVFGGIEAHRGRLRGGSLGGGSLGGGRRGDARLAALPGRFAAAASGSHAR